MKPSLARKYFLICLACVVASILVLGVVFMAFSTRYFERDKYSIMHRNAIMAAGITANNYHTDSVFHYVDEVAITTTYSVLSQTIDADFLLVDLGGHMVYHNNPEKMAAAKEVEIPQSIIEEALIGSYQKTGVFPGVMQSPSYVVGVPVVVGEKPVAVLFAISSANDLVLFMQQIIKMFLLSAGIVLLFSFILISYFASRMAKPLKQMLDATHSFARGDFSVRVPVSSYDELGQLSMAFNNMASSLATNESSRRSFIGNVSHELKTPMTTIGGFVDGMLDGTIPPEKQRHYLQIVSSEVQRLRRLVHSMLDTARIDAGEMELKLSNFDLSELVRKSVFSFEQRVEEKHLELLGLEQDRIMVRADQDLMHQVVYNLIENAVKFANDGGTISILYEKKNGKVFTTIRNSGEGLSKEDSEKIFDRFYKSDRSRGSHQGGVGLGLHIVRSIIMYHKGEIVAHSVEKEYTEFTFTIDAAPDSEKPLQNS